MSEKRKVQMDADQSVNVQIDAPQTGTNRTHRNLDTFSPKDAYQKIHDAMEMVSALCKPRHSEGAREWRMSIPARPDYDPDLVIAAGLRAGLDALEELETIHPSPPHQERP
jgi:hypothetical protein